jgi:hypothetical protein
VVETASSFGQENRILRLISTGGRPGKAVAAAEDRPLPPTTPPTTPPPASPAPRAGAARCPSHPAADPLGLGAGNAAGYGPGTPVASQSANAFAAGRPPASGESLGGYSAR